MSFLRQGRTSNKTLGGSSYTPLPAFLAGSQLEGTDIASQFDWY